MIIDLLNFRRHYPGTEADILFRLQEAGISVPPFFCITESFTEDELNSYLQNHFQYTERFSIKLSFSFESHGNNDITDSAAESPFHMNIPKSALAYSAEKLFAQAQEFVRKNYSDEAVLRYFSSHIIVQETPEADLQGCLHTACRIGLLNETIVFIGDPAPVNYSTNDIDSSLYCHNNTDGILFVHEPEGAVKAPITLIKRLLMISEKIKQIVHNTTLEIKFIADLSFEKIFIVSVTKINELEASDANEVILDTKGVCNYYPGVTEPLYASTTVEMSRHITDNMVKRTGYMKALSDSHTNIIEYVNGRLYFNTKMLTELQDALCLNEDSEKYINPTLRQFTAQVKECRGLKAWYKKRHAAAGTKRLLEDNLKHSKALCNKCRIALDKLSTSSSDLGYDTKKHSIEKIFTVISECINSNQLNTLYINLNRRLIKRLRPTEKKYAKTERSIALALLYRDELRRYHYSFIKLLRIHSLNLGHELVKRGIIDDPLDIAMLTFEEVISPDGALTSDIKKVVARRKTEFEWYRSLPNFSRLIFSCEAINAPVGKVDFICTVTEESHIRGCGLNMEKAEYRAVICKDNILPKTCDPKKIYVIDKFTDFSEKKCMGGLIIMQQPILANMNPDIIKVGFPVICGAEHALSVIHNGDLVSMDSAKGEIFIKHKK